MRILLPVDGSEFSKAAIAEVARRPWPQGSEVRIIAVEESPVFVGVEPWAAAPLYLEQLEAAVRQSAMTAIENAVTQLKTAQTSLRITTAAIKGSPTEVIVDEAERWRADLIVIGSRGLGAWRRMMLGSVSNAVLHHAKCSVEIVRKPHINDKEK